MVASLRRCVAVISVMSFAIAAESLASGLPVMLTWMIGISSLLRLGGLSRRWKECHDQCVRKIELFLINDSILSKDDYPRSRPAKNFPCLRRRRLAGQSGVRRRPLALGDHRADAAAGGDSRRAAACCAGQGARPD